MVVPSVFTIEHFPVKTLCIIFVFSLAAVFGVAERGEETSWPIDLNSPLPIVVLKDGRTLHNLKIVSFGSSTIMARWDGGRGTIAYAALPDEVRKVAEVSRPAPSKYPIPDAPKDSQAGHEVEGKKTISRAMARRGYSTRLLRQEAIGEPPDRPPRGVLDLVSYTGPLGPMAAYVSPPPRDGNRHPAIIWLVGGFSNSISSVAWTPAPPDNDQSASGFRQAGIIMMYPSLRGGNNNPGYRERFFGEVDDVIAAAQFLAGLDYVDPSRIYLGGHSTGGTLALLVAESGNQFRAVFSLSPAGDIRGYDQKAVPFDISDPNECRLRSPIFWLDSIQMRTFVFEGTESPSNIGELRAMAAVNRNSLVRFREISGGTHFTIVSQLVRDIAQQILKDDWE
jgi:pimeloyl-ACP methyl ester carboxylesterase